jgi:hypothetical protein
MSNEKKKVLEMLAEGKINPEDAERLLERLDNSGGQSGHEGAADTESSPGSLSPTGGLPKYLRVVVDSSDGDKVNIRVPLALVRTGLKLSTMLPTEANEKLHAKGIDLSHLGELETEELIKELRELTVDVDSGDGDMVRVFCE